MLEIIKEFHLNKAIIFVANKQLEKNCIQIKEIAKVKLCYY